MFHIFKSLLIQSEAKQCRQALDIANNEITILKKELNVKNNQLTELKYSWTVLNNKLKGLDEELCEKRNGVLKLQMQYKMAVFIILTYLFICTRYCLSFRLEKWMFSKKHCFRPKAIIIKWSEN